MLESLDTLIAFALIMTVVSLLITIVVQMTSAAMNLRGKHLADALALTLDTVVPGAKKTVDDTAKQLAQHILTLPHLSDNPKLGIDGKPKTSAVRASEVFATLVEIAGSGENQDLQKQAMKVLRQAGVPEAVFVSAESAKAAFEEIKTQIKSGGEAGPLASLVGKVDVVEAAVQAHVSDILSKGIQASEEAWKRFEFWFESSQDRAQQWFSANTRLLTVIFSAVAALVLQLDTVEIYHRVSSDPDLRAKLVEQAGSITSVAEKTIEPATEILQAAWCKWTTEAKDEKTEVGKLVKGLGDAAKGKVLAETVQTTDLRGAFVVRLREAMKEAAPELAGKVETSFVAQLEAEAKKQLADKSADFRLVKGVLDSSGFQLVPKGGWRWKNEWINGYWHHALGMLMTMGLLTLGAPFWFNTLKGLTNLRSVVAKDISQEEQAKKEAASRAGHAPPPGLPAR